MFYLCKDDKSPFIFYSISNNSERKFMKQLFWLTGSCFFDVDENIVPRMSKEYKIYWFILRQPESFYSKKDMENHLKKYHIEGEVVDWPRLRSLQSLKMYISLIHKMQSLNPALIYINYPGVPYLFPLLHVMRVDKSKIVYACHDFILHVQVKHLRFLQAYANFILKKFQNFQLFSKTQALLFQEKFGKNYFYAPLALKGFGSPTVDKVQNEKATFLFFGNIHRRKGIEYLIEATNILASKYPDKFIVRIYGDCEHWDEYEKRIRDKTCFDLAVRRVENDEIANLFATSDYLVLPYKEVTQSGPLLISYYYNLPVIASNHDGFKEYITPGETGFLFENENSESLASVMEQIIQKKYDNSVIRHNLSEFIAENNSLEKIVALYSEGFNKIIHS